MALSIPNITTANSAILEPDVGTGDSNQIAVGKIVVQNAETPKVYKNVIDGNKNSALVSFADYDRRAVPSAEVPASVKNVETWFVDDAASRSGKVEDSGPAGRRFNGSLKSIETIYKALGQLVLTHGPIGDFAFGHRTVSKFGSIHHPISQMALENSTCGDASGLDGLWGQIAGPHTLHAVQIRGHLSSGKHWCQ